MERYLCIHCHFYQPPRENPWLEAVELQDSAYPFHDWNERITAECYAPNAAARILDSKNRITQIVNNYRHISFNFGPTLLSWMEEKAPSTYQKILEADRDSRADFGGHGSALAQAYNHMILPLANRQDKRSQVIWGIRDFQRRFNRDPEGMWLPETAVDMETLEVLAKQGIKFTILAPHQARQARYLRRGSVWKNVEGAKIDPTKAYVCRLPSGAAIDVFFYDGPISRAVAFEGLLSNGETFAQRLLSGFNDTRKWAQLMHIATDGETYGHHHNHGDMALAYALHYIESRNLAKITNYGQYLEKHPPNTEVEILSNTSWSCAHGIERWRDDCGCNSGMKPGWNQQWRGPARRALDFLREALATPFAERARNLLKDPWIARDEYVDVMLDRSPGNLWRFFEKHATHQLTPEEVTTALKLLEMQRHLMLMYTSCGWFFDELSGIETVQVIFYAGRALQLAQELFGNELEQPFLDRLASARSNVPNYGDGRDIYLRWVKPAIVDLLGVGAHYAISSAFDGYGEQSAIFCYNVEQLDRKQEETGRARLTVGYARIRSQITLEQALIAYGVLHLGDHNVNAGVRHFAGEHGYVEMRQNLLSSFERAEMSATLRALDQYFPDGSFSIKSLFRDEQRRILDQIMKNVLSEAEASYRAIYETHASLMRFLAEMHIPPPRVLRLTSEFVLNSSLLRELNAGQPNLGRISALLDTARRDDIGLDSAALSYALRKRVGAMMESLVEAPLDLGHLRQVETAVRLAHSLSLDLDLWKAQNLYWGMLQSLYPTLLKSSDPQAQEWTKHFVVLGEKLGINLGEATTEVPVAA